LQGGFTYKKSIVINAPVPVVWRALTDPESIKEIYFGMDWFTNWEKGSIITFSGDYDHQPFEDKGNILDIEKEKFILFDHFSPDSGKEDIPENYRCMRFELAEKNNATVFTVYEYGFESEEKFKTVITKWDSLCFTLKEITEKI